MEEKSNFVMLSVVAIVAIVALVVLVTGTTKVYNQPTTIHTQPVFLDNNQDNVITGQAFAVPSNSTNSTNSTNTTLPYRAPRSRIIPGPIGMNATNQTNCTDTDGGNRPYTGGTVMSSPPPRSFIDVCLAPTTLREYFCASRPGGRFDVMYQRYTCNCVTVAGRGLCR